MFRAALIPALLASCATTGLDTTSTNLEAASPAQIEPIDPELPSVDHIASLVRTELGDDATAKLRLCVQPSGKLATVKLAKRSMLPEFDHAVIQDVTDWRFEPTAGPVEHCELFTVIYHPYLG
ncbi:MAG TPA: energy transducer TonB [Kofleriaceae bacterium]|jgi:TonB family protein|nr:energy transducer TonB [Kofleriaceae bacterium]